MNPGSKKEAQDIVQALSLEIEKIDLDKKEIIICPPFLYLALFKKDAKIKLGAQNLCFGKGGSFTGGISAQQLKDIVEYVIIGHAERRIYCRETHEEINQKIKNSLENDLSPIFCIGENSDEMKDGLTANVLERQITQGLKEINLAPEPWCGVNPKQNKKIIIAYEPIWAIGTGLIPTYEQVLETKNSIQKILKKLNFDLPIIYGGSVDENNIQGFIKVSKMDGVLIGKKSLDPKAFIKIIDKI